MSGSLYDVLQWLEKNGEPRAMSRLRTRLLPFTFTENVVLDNVVPETTCSAAYLSAARNAASVLVGTKCPV